MVSDVRNTSATVIERLRAEPWRFNFFAAVLWLERLERARDDRSSAVGDSPSPDGESIRFHALQQQYYAASDVVRVKPRTMEDRDAGWELTVGMMGLTGPNGVLPAHYTRIVVDQLRKTERAQGLSEKSHESALPDFFDFFNHRQISLFYRAWKKYRLEALYTDHLETDSSVDDDPVTTVLFSLIGLATGRTDRPQTLRNRHEFGDQALIYYSGAFSRWPRSPVTLKNVLAEMFQLPVEIIEFQPQWCNLRPEDQFRLSPPGSSLGGDSALGTNVMIGSRICLFDTRFRVRLGPLGREQFDALLPEGNRFRPLVQFICFYVGREWDFDIQLVLKADEVPYSRLAAGNSLGSQLARNTWVLNRGANRDQDQVVLIPDGLN